MLEAEHLLYTEQARNDRVLNTDRNSGENHKIFRNEKKKRTAQRKVLNEDKYRSVFPERCSYAKSPPQGNTVVFRIQIGSGFNWVSGSGSRQAKLSPKRNKLKNIINLKRAETSIVGGKKTYGTWRLFIKKYILNFLIFSYRYPAEDGATQEY